MEGVREEVMTEKNWPKGEEKLSRLVGQCKLRHQAGGVCQAPRRKRQFSSAGL